MATDESDQLLVEAVRRGDESAWQQLIDRFEGRLYAFARSRLRDTAASEDVVQEAFVGFLTSLPNYDPKTPLETWLFTITAHKLTDHLRREGRRPTLPLAGGRDSSSGSPEPAGRARVASSLLRSRERRDVEDIVLGDGLSELIRGWRRNGEWERLKCIELLFVGGLSNKAVAEALEITQQAVANHKYFAVSKLKQFAERSRIEDFDPDVYGLS